MKPSPSRSPESVAERVTPTAFSRLQGVTSGRVSQWIKAGLPVGADGLRPGRARSSPAVRAAPEIAAAGGDKAAVGAALDRAVRAARRAGPHADPGLRGRRRCGCRDGDAQ
jgi:hypothetical protein